MEYFLSCDWGTSSLRVRLASIAGATVLTEVLSDEGIAGVFHQWGKANLTAPEKAAFYLEKLKPCITEIERKTGKALAGIKLVISGMASSSIGFIDVPYTALPFSVNGEGINTVFVKATGGFLHDVLVVGGVKTTTDVIRGEETQLLGCTGAHEPGTKEWFILPGTHSKHILVENNQVTDFKTYMTGEVFNLLSGTSILKNSVETGEDNFANSDSFLKGVRKAQNTSLRHAVFGVRTNQLFNLNTKIENYNYLSGLLIGAELEGLAGAAPTLISLVAGGNLSAYYRCALTELFPRARVRVFSTAQAARAVVMGQLKIAGKLNFLG
jgi:2-dehydro-3-deoxygalactonokinase